MGTYSFKNINGTFTGPGVSSFSIGQDSGAAPEGITVNGNVEEKDKMDTGAGGEIMHSLNASDSGQMTVRLLKTSVTNALFQAAYNFQKENPGAWGQNVIRFADVVRGDVVSASEMAFVRQATLVYAKEGNMMEWELQGRVHQKLGTGVPAVIPQ
jgi:hypothetical protein